ncbi:MAG: CBS domain-containing protein [Thermoanaerobaculales bacterium]|jgi:CBS domain-containing protein|nr:CBS domain-containing protein [Thermoanaerobaculales bacterium]
MGEHDVRPESEAEEIRVFLKHLLNDVRAFEMMLTDDLFERDIRRIGAEQELFLVDQHWRPAPIATEVLEAVADPHFTTELARFNLEFNLDPQVFGGTCLSAMEWQVGELLGKAREAARRCGGDVLMTGILPTIVKSDLGLENMTPNPRYLALNEAMTRLKGGAYEFYLTGVDELHLHHDSIMVEACNTSFQVHFQVAPHEFARLYNIAQAVAGPVLAAAVNSPLLFGKRLWQETRVGLFQQSIDTRRSMPHLREQTPRVSFGKNWVIDSALEIFREDIGRFRALLSTEPDDDPFEMIAQGRAPSLKALRLHNSTVYRWNRVCYGISDGKPHLRIENRILPSGPTPRDEVANAAFWFGLVSGCIVRYYDITGHMSFDDAHANFFAAAAHGLGAQLHWVGDVLAPADRLILDELLPLAREGLQASRIDGGDIDLYLGTIEERVASRHTGAQWQIISLGAMGVKAPLAERLAAVTAAISARQQDGRPVATWELATLDEGGGWKQHYLVVEHCMDTDLFTVAETEPVELVANLMVWNNIRHVMVEDADHRLIGMVSQRALIKLVGAYHPEGSGSPLPVSAIMKRDPVTVTPETSTVEAIDLMRSNGWSCLPVIKDGRLVGVVTENQLMTIAGQLLEQQLRE